MTPDTLSPILLSPSHDAVETLEAYRAQGGLEGLERARGMSPDDVIAEVTRSNLRGRGGAGFPTGKKWAAVAASTCPTRYIVCNAAEGEPGTFKDRYLIRKNPYVVLEGLLIAAHALGAAKAYVGLKRRFTEETTRFQSALAELVKANVVPKAFVRIALGPDDYLLGEEKGLLEAIEGRRPAPRVLPSRVEGLFRRPNAPNPTAVNNVETLANVPHILVRGGAWFRSLGPEASPGTMLFTLCGDVARPGLYELPMGTPLRTLLEGCGQGPSGRAPWRMALSGAANAVITPSQFDTPLDFDAMRAAGSGLGAGGFMIYDETACPVRVGLTFSAFLARESCGQCTMCVKGTADVTALLRRLEEGEADAAEALEPIRLACGTVAQANRCYLPVQEQLMIPSLLDAFPEICHAHGASACGSSRKIPLPLIDRFDAAHHAFQYYEPETRPWRPA